MRKLDTENWSQLMRGALTKPTGILLVLTNLIPVFGVIYLGWDVGTLLILYWLESLIIGALNVPKMLACRAPGDNVWISVGLNLFNVAFFVIHYGMFTFVHGIFVYSMFADGQKPGDILQGGPLFWTALGLLFSHVVSMLNNFFWKQEYYARKVSEQMSRPYGRVIIMHVVIIFGGFLVMTFGSPLLALLLLIALKVTIDLIAHGWDHKLKMEDAAALQD